MRRKENRAEDRGSAGGEGSALVRNDSGKLGRENRNQHDVDPPAHARKQPHSGAELGTIARSGSSGESLSFVSPPASGSSSALGSFSARVGGDPLPRCCDGAAPVLC